MRCAQPLTAVEDCINDSIPDLLLPETNSPDTRGGRSECRQLRRKASPGYTRKATGIPSEPPHPIDQGHSAEGLSTLSALGKVKDRGSKSGIMIFGSAVSTRDQTPHYPESQKRMRSHSEFVNESSATRHEATDRKRPTSLHRDNRGLEPSETYRTSFEEEQMQKTKVLKADNKRLNTELDEQQEVICDLQEELKKNHEDQEDSIKEYQHAFNRQEKETEILQSEKSKLLKEPGGMRD
jgi:hypothetical protein